jgi:hypothetical protein
MDSLGSDERLRQIGEAAEAGLRSLAAHQIRRLSVGRDLLQICALQSLAKT